MTPARPRILFATGAAYVWPLRTAFELARAAGCDGVELDVSPQSILGGPRLLARLAAKTGLAVRAVHPPLFGLPGWGDPVVALGRLVDLALAAGIRTIVVHPPKATRPDAPLLAAFSAALRAARHRLQGSGTEVTLENPGFFRPRDRAYPLWDLARLHAFAAGHGLRLTLDTAHAGASPRPLLECYQIARDRLAHVHLSDLRQPPRCLDRPLFDSYVKHHQLPGTGHLPLGEFLRALACDGFAGDLTLELSPASLALWRPARARTRLARAVQDVRRALET